MIDPAIPHLVVVKAETASPGVFIELGDGPAFANSRPDSIVIVTVPPGTESRTRVTTPHSIQTLSIPENVLASLLPDTELDGSFAGTVYGELKDRIETARLMDALWS